MEEKIFIVFHKVDYDGLISSCIVNEFYHNEGKFVGKYGCNYNDADYNNFNVEKVIKNYNKIIIVDFSFPPDTMLKLANSNVEVIWIDHHITAIEDSKKYGYDELKGLRDISKAACELCWEYFYSSKPPKFISLINSYDIWDKTTNDWDNEVFPLQFGLRYKYKLNLFELEAVFDDLISSQKLLEELISIGTIISSYQGELNKSNIKNHGFPVLVDNKLRGVCLLSPNGGSYQFKSVENDYDLCIIINKLNKTEYNLSMYGLNNDIGDFNCADYLRKISGNGGGHKSAAGCKISFDLFKNILENEQI